MIFAIGDLHLPLGIDKPMDVFGERWENYVERLHNNWQLSVGKDDTVVMPGDFSWATYIEQAERDFDFLEELNGRKIIIKGNHDYWWTTMTKMNEFKADKGYKTIEFLQNNSFTVEDVSICGTRGWIYPGFSGFGVDDEKYFAREALRLEMSIKSARTDEIYVFTHYPPSSRAGERNCFVEVMEKYNVKKCFYGHLHGASHINRIPEINGDIHYYLVSSDYLGFMPKCVRGNTI